MVPGVLVATELPAPAEQPDRLPTSAVQPGQPLTNRLITIAMRSHLCDGADIAPIVAQRLLATYAGDPTREDWLTRSLALMVCERVDVARMVISWIHTQMGQPGADPRRVLLDLLEQLNYMTTL